MLRHITTGIGHMSTTIADGAGRPGAQLVILVVCGAWLVDGGGLDALAASISIGGFVLTQMVLNQQRRREAALHLKIDELIIAIGGARNEVTGLEHRTEQEIEDLRAGHHEALDAAG